MDAFFTYCYLKVLAKMRKGKYRFKSLQVEDDGENMSLIS